MSLYDGVGLDNNKDKKKPDSDISGWGTGMKLLQSQLQLRKATLTKPQRDRERTSKPNITPVIDLKRQIVDDDDDTGSPLQAMHQIHAASARMPTSEESSRSIKSERIDDPDSMTFMIEDEYDPMHPNDYEIIKENQRKEKQKIRDEEKKKESEERERRRRERHMERERKEVTMKSVANRSDDEDEDENDSDAKKPRRGGAEIAPPPSLSDIGGAAEPPPPGLEPPIPAFTPNSGKNLLGFAPGMGANSVAAKIMKKYGFREGGGLGKNEQGLSRALEVEKTSKRGGKILSETNEEQMPSMPVMSTADIMKNPSKVALLRNMVGRGEVDEDLDEETTEECAKYGKVVKCVIYEMPPTFPDDEAVRIFIEFERMESAIKAVIDLNGRFFGGRTVKGGFYNVDKFRSLELSADIV